MSVQRRTRGGRTRYEVRWREEGAQRSRTFDRAKDARDWEAEVRRRAQLGAHAPAEPSRDRLEDWLVRWFAAGMDAWARSTVLQRASVLDRWIKPYIGGVRLRDLGPGRVSEWRTEIVAVMRAAENDKPEGDRRSPNKRANAAMRVLSAALAAAQGEGLIPSNPCAGIKRLPTETVDRRALSADQAERVRAALPTQRDRVLWGLLYAAGLRTEEALAVRWRDFVMLDRTGGLLAVERAWTHGEIRDRVKSGPPRDVDIIAPLAEDVLALRAELAPVGEDELVCPSLGRADRQGRGAQPGAGGPLDLNNWRPRTFDPAAAAAGVPWATPYTGRRTFISLMIHAGVSPVLVAASVGHTSGETIWRHYARQFDRARHTEPVPLDRAIRAARRRVARATSVRPMCDGATVTPLRRAAGD